MHQDIRIDPLNQDARPGRSWRSLTVNQGNIDSIAIYRKCGLVVREEALFDIGNGYVMDDVVMEKLF